MSHYRVISKLLTHEIHSSMQRTRSKKVYNALMQLQPFCEMIICVGKAHEPNELIFDWGFSLHFCPPFFSRFRLNFQKSNHWPNGSTCFDSTSEEWKLNPHFLIFLFLIKLLSNSITFSQQGGQTTRFFTPLLLSKKLKRLVGANGLS